MMQMVLAAALGFASAQIVIWPLGAFLRANFRSYALFRFDKAQAEGSGQRVPEVDLLEAARRGGWFGAKLAQRRFRHKTRKEPFRSQLNHVGKVQAVKVALLAWAVVMVSLVPSEGEFAIWGRVEAAAAAGLAGGEGLTMVASNLAPETSLHPVRRPAAL
ncbi:MAG: DUF1294 domain-containing protein [Paracoccaceae bacterium]